jgi:hypothetical protein
VLLLLLWSCACCCCWCACCCCCQGEKLLYKPGKGAFYATDLEPWLHSKGITHLLIAGASNAECVKNLIHCFGGCSRVAACFLWLLLFDVAGCTATAPHTGSCKRGRCCQSGRVLPSTRGCLVPPGLISGLLLTV